MTLETLLAHPVAQALGRALLHFIWQGALLALVLWIVGTIAPPAAARLRYAASYLIMLLMPITLVVTAAWSSRSEPGAVPLVPRFSMWIPATTPEQVVYYAPTASAPHAGISGWFVCFWIVGVLFLSTRAAGGWIGVRKLKHGARPAGAELESIVRNLRRRLRVLAPVRLCTSAMVRIPTALGWFQPYILLPMTALTGLSAAQIEAILAHELAHIRRHDYLLNLLQTAIETVLFYHPAVWWVGKQVRLEREHCCDDIAVAVCGSAFEYANALAEMEQIRGEIPAGAMAAAGGDLLGRIRRVLGRKDHTSRSMGTVAAAVLVLSIVGATAVVSLYATPQEAQPSFEVASIKRDVSGQPGPMFRLFPGLHLERATLKDLVTMAYQVRDFQVTGGPGWINSDRYNIDAKAEQPAVFNQEYRALQYRRIQTMLRERFKLAIHRETKELPIYELTVAKGGPKLQPPNCIQREPGDLTVAPGKKMTDYCGFGGFTSRSRYEASNGSISELAGGLSLPLGRIVVDKTGITGRFHIQLTYTPDVSTIAFPDAAAPDRADGVPPADAAPDIFTALQEQLGLKLESSKGSAEVLVIDHVEKLSEN